MAITPTNNGIDPTRQEVPPLPSLESAAVLGAQVPYHNVLSLAQQEADIARFKAIAALANEITTTIPNSAGNLQLIQAYSHAIGEIK